MSFYWALGGELGLNTLGQGVQALAHECGFVALVWLAGIVKVLGGLFALTLVRPWLLWLPPIGKLVLAWVGGAALALYGGVNLVVEWLLVIGAIHLRGVVVTEGIRWHAWLWDPWWLLGGILFLLAAWQYQRSLRNARQAKTPTLTSL